MEYRDINELKKLESNPRVIKDKNFKILCESIKNNPEFFEARPIILSNRTGELVIIAGNQRYDAAKKIKLKKVPTFLIENLTEEKEREIIIRDNSHSGVWDYSLLKDWDSELLFDWGLNEKFNDIKPLKIERIFQLNINCKDEKDLKEKYENLTKLGYVVNILQI